MRRPDWKFMGWAFGCIVGLAVIVPLVNAFAKG